MNQKELREIRRRIQPERSNIRHLYGCYVNSNKEIISRIDESLGLLSKEEQEKYLALLKKSLSGTLGKNLLDISFATKQVMDSDEYRLLASLRRTELNDAELRESFYKVLIDAMDLEDNYLILMALDSYDVPRHRKDGAIDEDRGEVFKYMLVGVCPVKTGKLELGYVPEEKRFRSSLAGQVVAAPEMGFMFPTFDDRTANIYNALFYTRNSGEAHDGFIEAVFRTKVPMSAARQRETFDALLEETAPHENSFDVVQSVHEQLSERIALHKESRDPEPLSLTIPEMGELLEKSGTSPEQTEAFCHKCEEEFGADAALSPANLTDPRRMTIEASEVKISVDPKFGYLIQPRIIDGKKYILVSADQGIELNGIAVEIGE